MIDGEPLDTLVVYVPVEATESVMSALFVAGAGRIGRYAECAFVSRGRGQFRPMLGANPAIGDVGELAELDEDRVEVTLPRSLRASVVAALRLAHPYEEPAFHVVEHAPIHPEPRGTLA